MNKVASTDVRLRHVNGLWLDVENLGSKKAENDTYTRDEGSASVFKTKAIAVAAAKRPGLQRKDFEIT